MASSPRSLIHHDPTLWRASVQEPQQAAESSQETEPEPGGPKVVSGYSVAISNPSVTPDLRGSSWCAFLSLSKDLESLHHYFSSCFVRGPTSDLRHRSTVQLVTTNIWSKHLAMLQISQTVSYPSQKHFTNEWVQLISDRWGHAQVQVDDSAHNARSCLSSDWRRLMPVVSLGWLALSFGQAANDQRVEHLFEQSTCVQVFYFELQWLIN